MQNLSSKQKKIMIGNDLVYLPRLKESLAKDRFIEKIFHPIEIAYCENKKDKLSSYGARFAAKEACAKALGTGLYAHHVSPLDIWIQNNKNGKPELYFSIKLTEILNYFSIEGYDVSLTHHQDYAMAYVILYR